MLRPARIFHILAVAPRRGLAFSNIFLNPVIIQKKYMDYEYKELTRQSFATNILHGLKQLNSVQHYQKDVQ